MAVNPDGEPAASGEKAAHRRWLITIAITIVFGAFGAVMAYLSYVHSTRPGASSPGGARPSGAPSPDEGDQGKHGKGNGNGNGNKGR
jgi:hypothetical protein